VTGISVYSVDSNDVAALCADVEWFCGELVELPPAARLGLVAELRMALDEVTGAALTAGMTSAQRLGLGAAPGREPHWRLA